MSINTYGYDRGEKSGSVTLVIQGRQIGKTFRHQQVLAKACAGRVVIPDKKSFKARDQFDQIADSMLKHREQISEFRKDYFLTQELNLWKQYKKR